MKTIAALAVAALLAVPVSAKPVPASPVNVNTASLTELITLPRIGPVLAARIIAGRPYTSAADLLRVKGLKAVTLAGLQSLVRVK